MYFCRIGIWPGVVHISAFFGIFEGMHLVTPQDAFRYRVPIPTVHPVPPQCLYIKIFNVKADTSIPKTEHYGPHEPAPAFESRPEDQLEWRLLQSAEMLSMSVEPIPATRMVPVSLPVPAIILPSEYLS